MESLTRRILMMMSLLKRDWHASRMPAPTRTGFGATISETRKSEPRGCSRSERHPRYSMSLHPSLARRSLHIRSLNFRAKLPDQAITVIPWHQDLAYLIPEEAGDTLVVNVWLPLVRATEENGCMQVIRGSHRYNLIEHNYQDQTPGHTGGKGISDQELPPGDIVTAELDVGDVLLTSERVVHRGLPNPR